jgi:hypothetical protein
MPTTNVVDYRLSRDAIYRNDDTQIVSSLRTFDQDRPVRVFIRKDIPMQQVLLLIDRAKQYLLERGDNGDAI